MDATLSDPRWDGVRVPEEARCGRPDGSAPAQSPALRVTGMPQGTDALLLAFNDVDYEPLATGGGHGVLRVEVPPGVTDIDVPAVPELTDTGLPAGVSVHAHNRGRSPIGYRAPCGGGDKAHQYEVVVTALCGTEAVAECVVSLGTLDGEPAWLSHHG